MKKRKQTLDFKIFDLIVLVFSCISVVTDIFTDIILVVNYSWKGYKEWAIGTLILIFFPSVIVQFFSLRWQITDKTASFRHWISHCFLLGIIHRYLITIKSGYNAFKSKNTSDIIQVYLDQSDLCMLHLFESFLESCPQLVLQVYLIAIMNEWQFWTVVSVLVSLFSLSWALATYTKTQRQAKPNKNRISWTGMLLQAIWRAGMLTARIAALVVSAYSFGNYIFLYMAFHWIAMTVWIIHQKTDFCESYWEEKIYNLVVGVIYCFCFFNLREGQSRWRLLAFYTIIGFENFSSLILFLMWYGKSAPTLALVAFSGVIGGTIVGVASMLIYYRFYHPNGHIKFSTPSRSSRQQRQSDFCSMTLCSLRQMRGGVEQAKNIRSPVDTAKISSPISAPSDSIIIIEENYEDLKTIRDLMGPRAVSTSPTTANDYNPCRALMDENAIKRRPICSTSDLAKLFDSETGTTDGSIVTTDFDTSNGELSLHLYENVNDVRDEAEVVGKSDESSEMYQWTTEDESSVISNAAESSDPGDEKPRGMPDTPVTVSPRSDDILVEYSVESLTVTYPLGSCEDSLDRPKVLTPPEPPTARVSEGHSAPEPDHSCSSTLVATIDEITQNTPISNRCSKSDRETLSPDITPWKRSRSRKRVSFLTGPDKLDQNRTLSLGCKPVEDLAEVIKDGILSESNTHGREVLFNGTGNGYRNGGDDPVAKTDFHNHDADDKENIPIHGKVNRL